MIRPLTLTALLCITPIVLAQSLYKWVESDGSITFSVEPPPKGVEYETIDAAQPMLQSETPVDAISQPASAFSEQKAAPVISRSEPTQRVAPQAGAGTELPLNDNLSATSASRPADSGAATPKLGAALSRSSSNTATQSQSQSQSQSQPIAMMSRKQQQCEDLKKRVISLERRLTTRLTPEDMDNTVVHMARYQRSYDHHCVQ